MMLFGVLILFTRLKRSIWDLVFGSQFQVTVPHRGEVKTAQGSKSNPGNCVVHIGYVFPPQSVWSKYHHKLTHQPDLDNPSVRLFPSDSRLAYWQWTLILRHTLSSSNKSLYFCLSVESRQKGATEAWRGMLWLPFQYFKLLLFLNCKHTKGIYHQKYLKRLTIAFKF